MTAREVIDGATRRGVDLRVKGDQLTWRAPVGIVTPGVIAELREHKKGILEELREPEIVARQRYARPPHCEIPLAAVKPSLADSDAELLENHIRRQPHTVVRWVCVQAKRYEVVTDWQPPAVREWAAMLDCLLWQWEGVLVSPEDASRKELTQEAIQMLRDNEDDVKYIDENWDAIMGNNTKGA